MITQRPLIRKTRVVELIEIMDDNPNLSDYGSPDEVASLMQEIKNVLRWALETNSLL